MDEFFWPAYIAGFLFLLFCMRRESQLTGFYKTFHIYGRFTAYSILLIPVCIAGSIEAVHMKQWPLVAFGLLIAVLLLLLVIRAWIKCPPHFNKFKMLISMIISGIGVAGKITFFFLFHLWRLNTPEAVQTQDGKDVFISQGCVYDSSGRWIGVMNDDLKSFTYRDDI